MPPTSTGEEKGPRLVIRPGEADEHVRPLSGGTLTIGRSEENDVCIDDPSLSRRHARITRGADGTVTFSDLGSKNGSFVDGIRIDRVRLGPRHYLTCGDVVFSFVHEPDTAAGVGAVSIPGHADAGPPRAARAAPRASARERLETMLSTPSPSGARGLSRVTPRPEATLRVLLTVSELLASPGDLDEVLGRSLDLTFQLLDVDRAVVLLAGDGGQTPMPRVARRRDGGRMGLDAHDPRVVDRVMARGEAATFQDVRAGETAPSAITAAMAAPLFDRQGQAVGALYVDCLEPSGRRRLPRPADLEFLSAFAHQVSLAIENAGLRERLEKEVQHRSHLQRFFPPQTVDVLIRSGGSLRTTETEATVLFCDISGYTRLCATHPPRAVLERLNAFFPPVVAAVMNHGGTLEKYVGDALLAVWGAPAPRDDDATRAVTAAVAMQQAITRLDRGLRASDPADGMAVHIGIASGPVAAGNIGTEDYLQYATVGAVTTRASRICGTAGPGEILIDAATRARLGTADFKPEALPPRPLRGLDVPEMLSRIPW
ncbi:MAG: adenylate/guanylate cyclase domain-containing protein [Myxococcota bacterium]